MLFDDDEVMLNVLRCHLTYQGQAETNAEDGHLDSHTAPELCQNRNSMSHSLYHNPYALNHIQLVK